MLLSFTSGFGDGHPGEEAGPGAYNARGLGPLRVYLGIMFKTSPPKP